MSVVCDLALAPGQLDVARSVIVREASRRLEDPLRPRAPPSRSRPLRTATPAPVLRPDGQLGPAMHGLRARVLDLVRVDPVNPVQRSTQSVEVQEVEALLQGRVSGIDKVVRVVPGALVQPAQVVAGWAIGNTIEAKMRKMLNKQCCNIGQLA